ncbi:MAG: N-acetyl-gamma-glutamyl-phosphate reductase [Clostridiales bacterium]|jgi:N-acetyl-gamma-glutamyl-phosphate reductase|nr:N-acetyl-gamma-glutamyl-phosphate reductase [Clostridiales bacterium]MCI2160860.1 N-acetyl-gamma-glutamyl-phosphate reductase [Oscillospiraceae bacterium]CAB1242239.1 N-acetylglutamate gamma-semialdehyde dehydrogenase [Ruminococcaceae bacterium BL-4]MCI1961629.1 N-acetyl-gamma-glutamyl-phosphate reductase [Clostridiales bacterium]MCI2021962.1 N-acetyl-gamma-glutamyl-phosphate reductase [Clostridiales bacterium]
MKSIKVGVVGATGYAGAELCRLLANHPQASLTAISSVSFEGKALSEVYPSYYGLCDMICGNQEQVVEKSDVIFAALPHGLSQALGKECWDQNKVFIDLGADFRLEKAEDYELWYKNTFQYPELHKEAVYGLPELFREEIKGKHLIANPGCYTTAVPLALVPALKAGLIEQDGIIADCKSGVTGAGRNSTQDTHYPELNEGMHAYKVAAHRHTPEIEQSLSKITGNSMKVLFVPHLLPVNRGILATCYAKLKNGTTLSQLQEVYEKAYQNEYFIRLLPKGKEADIHNVRYSNFCDISLHIDPRTNTFIAVSALDNMVKGAAGQAIQNMNLAFGLDETEGLTAWPPAF